MKQSALSFLDLLKHGRQPPGWSGDAFPAQLQQRRNFFKNSGSTVQSDLTHEDEHWHPKLNLW